MKALLPPLALGAALGIVALVAAVTFGSAGEPTAAERADALARELRCPDCQGLSVSDSPTQSAQEIRRQIDELVAAGASDDEVRAHFVARYGEWILLAPSSPWLWLLPFVVLLAGVAALGVWLGGRGPAVRNASAPSAVERRGVREEAEILDA